MGKSQFELVGELGDLLGDRILAADGTSADVKNVCFKFGQYCRMFGVQKEHVVLFFRYWREGEPTLQLPNDEYSVMLFQKFYDDNKPIDPSIN